ncbi:MAG: lysyl oxidase family protein [Gaiellales bacterium]
MLALSNPGAASVTPAGELPNLVPLPAFDIAIEAQSPGGTPALHFAAATANKGDFALDLLGKPGGSTETAPVDQCVAWAADRVCEAREMVGEFVWHPDHGHYHFEKFAQYELRRFRRSGAVDMRPGGLVATSGKVSYCVIDVEQDRDADSPVYEFPHPLYYSCYSPFGFQGISPGWRDIYSAGTPGQEFPLEALSAGRFAIVIRSNPAGILKESSLVDNVSVTGIEISHGLAEVSVFCLSEPGSLACDQPVE